MNNTKNKSSNKYQPLTNTPILQERGAKLLVEAGLMERARKEKENGAEQSEAGTTEENKVPETQKAVETRTVLVIGHSRMMVA